MNKIVLLLLTFSIFSVSAQNSAVSKVQKNYVAGKHYTIIDPAFETDNADQVIVYEFFGYTCPHCSNFQAYIKPWHKKLPENVKLVRIPVIFQSGWEIYAKAYYTAETMGIIEKTHQPLFDAIHKERKNFRTIEQLADWFESKFSVDRATFLSTANSFMIDSKVRQSNNMMRKMQVTSTPTVIVNGKYKPNVKELGTITSMLDMVSYLSDLESKEMNL
ncbi:MAG: thiol:disulfide interchange protein DsbA/DsbL [Marinicellaceae bacterium]